MTVTLQSRVVGGHDGTGAGRPNGRDHADREPLFKGLPDCSGDRNKNEVITMIANNAAEPAALPFGNNC
ncbi:MAG: hypothetical protein AABZ73_00145 [Pseudomonadota bacterium]|uniref:hypothetical protein n=1 Tax=Sphingobium sp. TaxID=1912891 RepID=UPI002E1B4FEC